MLQFKEEFFLSTLNMTHMPFQIFWALIVLRQENQGKPYQAAQQTNLNKFKNTERNTKALFFNFCNSLKTIFGQSDAQTTCMHV